MSKKFVVVVDMQYDFVMANGRLPVADAEAIIVPGIRFLASLNPDEIAGVLFTYDTHVEDEFIGSEENTGNPDTGVPGFPLHCEHGTPGWENVFNSKIIPTAIPVYTLKKGVFDMWAEDHIRIVPVDEDVGRYDEPGWDRDECVRRLQEDGIDTVIAFGVAGDFCLKYAVQGLAARGFKVEIPDHLTRGIIRQIEQVVTEDFPDGSVMLI
jgi:nicotinamidase/pyrazinamidase